MSERDFCDVAAEQWIPLPPNDPDLDAVRLKRAPLAEVIRFALVKYAPRGALEAARAHFSEVPGFSTDVPVEVQADAVIRLASIIESALAAREAKAREEERERILRLVVMENAALVDDPLAQQFQSGEVAGIRKYRAAIRARGESVQGGGDDE